MGKGSELQWAPATRVGMSLVRATDAETDGQKGAAWALPAGEALAAQERWSGSRRAAGPWLGCLAVRCMELELVGRKCPLALLELSEPHPSEFQRDLKGSTRAKRPKVPLLASPALALALIPSAVGLALWVPASALVSGLICKNSPLRKCHSTRHTISALQDSLFGTECSIRSAH